MAKLPDKRNWEKTLKRWGLVEKWREERNRLRSLGVTPADCWIRLVPEFRAMIEKIKAERQMQSRIAAQTSSVQVARMEANREAIAAQPLPLKTREASEVDLRKEFLWCFANLCGDPDFSLAPSAGTRALWTMGQTNPDRFLTTMFKIVGDVSEFNSRAADPRSIDELIQELIRAESERSDEDYGDGLGGDDAAEQPAAPEPTSQEEQASDLRGTDDGVLQASAEGAGGESSVPAAAS